MHEGSRRSMCLVTAVVTAIMTCTVAAAAAATEDLSAAISACRAEQDDSKRLACYDRHADGLTGAPGAAPGTPAISSKPSQPRAAAPAAGESTAGTGPAVTREERFGYVGGPLAKEDAAKKADEEEAVSAEGVVSKVTAVSQRPRGELVVTLENGQVWLQKVADSSFKVAVGDTVTVEQRTLRSFHMTREGSKRTTRVTRLE
jgi:co-chaperonin GroES (HSP10)